MSTPSTTNTSNDKVITQSQFNPSMHQSSFNPMHIPDMIINTVIAQEMSKLFTNFSFSKRSIISFAFLIFLGEIKKVVGELLTNIINLIKKSPGAALVLYTKYRKFKDRHIENISTDTESQNPASNYIIIDADQTFLYSLYNYINKQNKLNKLNKPNKLIKTPIDFFESISEIKIQNTKDRMEKLKISNIIIGDIRIANNLHYTVDINTKQLSAVNIESSVMLNKKSTNSYLDFLNEDQRSMIFNIIEQMSAPCLINANNTHCYNSCLLKITSSMAHNLAVEGRLNDFLGNDKVFMGVIYKGCQELSNSYYCEFNLMQCILKKYPTFGQYDTLLYMCAMSIVSCRSSGSFFNSSILSKYTSNKVPGLSPNVFKSYIYNNVLFSSIKCVTAPLRDSIFGSLVEKIGSSTEPAVTTDSNKLIIEFPFNYTESQKRSCAKILVNKISKYQNKTTSNVKIFNLTLETITETSTINNPDYDKWLEKKEMIENMSKDNNDGQKKKSKCNIDITSIDIPPKMLTVEKQKKQVVATQINETNKDIDTLYLRETDKKKLFSSVNQFKNKADLFDKLGLQRKLNILLFGEPGTGKSTTIVVVATYLGKDIYYIDLKNAESNNDLQIMIEYVNKNVSNGGIVVIEDIDAMTEVVHKRSSKISDETIASLIKNREAKLSLEYFLNILQGSLTLDESVFIVTTNHLDKLDPAFYRDGRFDVKIELLMCDHHQISTIYKKLLERDIDANVLARIPINKYSPATIIFHLKQYILDTDIDDEEIMKIFFDC